MKTLHLNFNSSDRKKTTLAPKVAREDLSSEEVADVMASICALELFEKNGEALYVSPHSAYYKEVIMTHLV